MTTDQLVPLGRIVRLQIQRSPLKLGEKPDRVYDPSALLRVDELTVTAEGSLARLPDGGVLLDVHHTGHPQTRNVRGANDLSVGFTQHYAQMRLRYGEHLTDGIAGENITVESEAPVGLEQLQRGLAVASSVTGGLVWLRQVRVDPPCREFSAYATRGSEPEAIKDALQFLDNGLRGYYCAYDGPGQAVFAVGDEVWVPAPGRAPS